MFVEYERVIVMKSDEDAHLRKVIACAAGKWAAFEATGSDRFKEQVQRLAREMGYVVIGGVADPKHQAVLHRSFQCNRPQGRSWRLRVGRKMGRRKVHLPRPPHAP